MKISFADLVQELEIDLEHFNTQWIHFAKSDYDLKVLQDDIMPLLTEDEKTAAVYILFHDISKQAIELINRTQEQYKDVECND